MSDAVYVLIAVLVGIIANDFVQPFDIVSYFIGVAVGGAYVIYVKDTAEDERDGQPE